MKTLYLMRHAKSSWKDESLADFERPLNGRGIRAAELMGRFLRQQKALPDLVLSSSATRARDTIERVLKAAKLTPELRFDERIYLASPAKLFEVVSQIEKERKVVLLVGHNPGMEELLHLFTGGVERMPTAALANISFKASKWSEVKENTGTLEWFVRPSDLSGSK